MRSNVRTSVGLVILIAACGCASLWATPQIRYGAAENACIEEAGSRAAADACRCKVKQAYPDSPQCTALPDGGWLLPMPPTPSALLPDGGVK